MEKTPLSISIFVFLPLLCNFPVVFAESQTPSTSTTPPPPPPPLSASPPPPPKSAPPQPRSPPTNSSSAPRRKKPRGGPTRNERVPAAAGRSKKESMNTGKEIGLVFVGIAGTMQIGVIGFLVYKRKQLMIQERY